MDYVNMREFPSSRSRRHSQIAFPTDKTFTMITTSDSNQSSSLSSISCCPVGLTSLCSLVVLLSQSAYLTAGK
ncbi:hypothetical protein T03_12121 [Trichinella britovi]|uniref:Uncharacterized protein n=1 Tax=Trichinella britovi TaxID=45882 RepID=A0A0V1DF80_TRIBR|nr:hypothetical protein T03_12121 [Trichinella britovi]